MSASDLEYTQTLAAKVANDGFSVVSGGAKGVDDGAIATRDGNQYRARAIRMDGDSLSFLTVPSSAAGANNVPEVVQIAASDIETIEFLSHGTGAVEGLLFGAAAGFLVGFTIGAVEADKHCGWDDVLFCGDPASVGRRFGLPSALIGLIGGAINGKHYRFDFRARRTPRRYR